MASTSSTPKRREWQPLFLDAFRESGNVKEACKAAGIDRKTAYNWREKSPAFAQAWDDAKEDAVDELEQIAFKRAKDTSDTLLIFLLKSHRSRVYRETQRHEVTGPDGGPQVIEVTINLAADRTATATTIEADDQDQLDAPTALPAPRAGDLHA